MDNYLKDGRYRMNVDNLECNCAGNAAYKITEVAIRHGLHLALREEFCLYVEKCIQEYTDEREWEISMGDDL